MIRTIAGFTLGVLLAACGRHETLAEPVVPADDPEAAVVKNWLDASQGDGPAPVANAAPDGAVAPVGDLVGNLEQRLDANPDDVKGWSLLARSYAFLGRMDDAQSAVERAVELGADRASLEAQVLDAHTTSR